MTATSSTTAASTRTDRSMSWRRATGEFLLGCARLASAAAHGRALALVEIGADRLHQLLEPAVEEMVGARDGLLVDDDPFLGLQLLDQRGHVLGRHDGILVAVHDQPRRRAGRQEREIIEICRGGDR